MSRTLSLVLLASFASASCSKDPKLVAKYEQQKTEIARLKGEVALIEEKLKNMPPDVSSDLEKEKKKAAEQTAEITRLENEIADLQSRKSSLESEFDSYRAKYQLK